MKLAYTYNLQIINREEEAEYDRRETVDAIAGALNRLGHEVEMIEVSGPASRVVARLEAINPQLVFNTAAGRAGRHREAFFPGLFEELSLPYTGSDSYVCTLALDKALTKNLVAANGILTPKWEFVRTMDNWTPPALRYPLMVKPNYESASKGITQESVVENFSELSDRVRDLLQRFREGIIIEEYIEGRDVVVPFLEKASPKTGGILAPAEYLFSPVSIANKRYLIYDYALQHDDDAHVAVKAPADLNERQMKEIAEASRKIYGLTGIRDLGRIDFRITPDGNIYFIEVNPLPSLELGATIYASAEIDGIKGTDAVLKAIIKSAVSRYGLESAMRTTARKTAYRVALTYNQKRIVAHSANDDDREAEYDSPKTINSITEAIASYGHEVVPIEATAELAAIISSSDIDFAFNIAEGIRGRSRESQVPAILELLDIPYTGSDPATLSITLDKGLAKRIVRQAGILTPEFMLMRTGKERLPKAMRYPVILKPNLEGSSKGVMGVNVVEDEKSLRETAQALIARYKQPVLVEEFLSGREFTLGLLGEHRPKVLPPMEIIFTNPDTLRPVYSFEHKLAVTPEIRYEAPAQVDSKLLKDMQRVARGAFMALGCADVARIDVRLDGKGRPHFLECNPLPGLTPGWSDLCLVAQAAGIDYRTLIGEIMAPTIRKLKERKQRPEVKTIPVV
ncbi:MAG: D-alanine--D-alanine ligase [Myxococcales bacterium]|nr:MAG: D-alanine--D-alanine ligase [Myxococcales bacterium]